MPSMTRDPASHRDHDQGEFATLATMARTAASAIGRWFLPRAERVATSPPPGRRRRILEGEHGRDRLSSSTAVPYRYWRSAATRDHAERRLIVRRQALRKYQSDVRSNDPHGKSPCQAPSAPPALTAAESAADRPSAAQQRPTRVRARDASANACSGVIEPA